MLKPWVWKLLGILCALFVLVVPVWAMLSTSGCANASLRATLTPEKTEKAARDLCTLRMLERGVLELEPKLRPPPDSLRARVQREEDEFCASMADAAAPPPLTSPPIGPPDASTPTAPAGLPPPAPS